jgi:hypothetical protein
MRRGLVIVLLAACGGTRAPETTYHAAGTGTDVAGADERVGGGRFARGEVDHALASARKAVELDDARLAEDDAKDDGKDPEAPVRRAALLADRVATASFAAQLDACLREPDDCPPSLDEPVIPDAFDQATHDFKGTFTADAAKWPATAAEIEKAACGCRTGACVEWVIADLARWEDQLPAAAQADESAATHVVGARECIWSRLGKKSIELSPPPSDPGGGNDAASE